MYFEEFEDVSNDDCKADCEICGRMKNSTATGEILWL